MKDRIKIIIESESISYSKFADLIGIQRSGISHIINGRNKPSLEVVQKILETFEYINTDWLLFGKGTMKNNENHKIQGDLFSQNIVEDIDIKANKEPTSTINSISDKIIEHSLEKKDPEPSAEANSDKKTAEKIIVLYTDKSFKEYRPE